MPACGSLMPSMYINCELSTLMWLCLFLCRSSLALLKSIIGPLYSVISSCLLNRRVVHKPLPPPDTQPPATAACCLSLAQRDSSWLYGQGQLQIVDCCCFAAFPRHRAGVWFVPQEADSKQQQNHLVCRRLGSLHLSRLLPMCPSFRGYSVARGRMTRELQKDSSCTHSHQPQHNRLYPFQTRAQPFTLRKEPAECNERICWSQLRFVLNSLFC